MPLEWKRNSEPNSHFCCQVPLLASYQAAVCIGHLSACEVLEVNCKVKIGQVLGLIFSSITSTEMQYV